MQRRITILFVVPTLGLGGVERALGAVLQRLDRRRFEPTLCVLGAGAGELVPPADVRVIALGRRSKWSFPLVVFRLIRLFRRHKPDAVIAFSGTANLAVLLAGIPLVSRPAILVTEHINPAEMYGGVEESAGRLKLTLIRLLYPRADAVLPVSAGIARQLIERFGLAPGRVRVAHTPVDIESLPERAAALPAVWPPGDGPVVVSVGRLTPQKNHALLLRALHGLDEVRALVIGDGPERTLLDALRGELGLEHVILAGADPNPFPAMARADLFVLSSDFEGFGVVLVEALALGTPVVSTDCPYGPAEILGDGAYGVLVPPGDQNALREAIRALLADPQRLRTLGASGPARAAEFSATGATRALEDAVSEACASRA